jgi:hypothetical protein
VVSATGFADGALLLASGAPLAGAELDVVEVDEQLAPTAPVSSAVQTRNRAFMIVP